MEEFFVEHIKTAFVLLTVFLAAGVVIGLLGSRFLKWILSKNGFLCPVVGCGETPLSMEEHERLCTVRIEKVDEKIDHIKEKVDMIWQLLNPRGS